MMRKDHPSQFAQNHLNSREYGNQPRKKAIPIRIQVPSMSSRKNQRKCVAADNETDSCITGKNRIVMEENVDPSATTALQESNAIDSIFDVPLLIDLYPAHVNLDYYIQM